MALVLKDRVKSNTVTTGTGTIVLGGAALGYQSFAVIGDANTTYYTISDATSGAWEVGIGTYYSGNTSLTRDTVLSSNNSSALVSFPAGTKDVFVTQPAEVTAIGAGSQAIVVNQTTVTSNAIIATGTNGFSVGPVTTANGVSVTVASGQSWVVI
jgi:hypothetical protein